MDTFYICPGFFTPFNGHTDLKQATGGAVIRRMDKKKPCNGKIEVVGVIAAPFSLLFLRWINNQAKLALQMAVAEKQQLLFQPVHKTRATNKKNPNRTSNEKQVSPIFSITNQPIEANEPGFKKKQPCLHYAGIIFSSNQSQIQYVCSEKRRESCIWHERATNLLGEGLIAAECVHHLPSLKNTS